MRRHVKSTGKTTPGRDDSKYSGPEVARKLSCSRCGKEAEWREQPKSVKKVDGSWTHAGPFGQDRLAYFLSALGRHSVVLCKTQIVTYICQDPLASICKARMAAAISIRRLLLASKQEMVVGWCQWR